MPNYIAPEDDGLKTCNYGKWTEEKLDYLTRYIERFETSMRDKPWRARHYIDLQAGPGKCRVKRTTRVLLGSPLIALTTEHPFTGYFFVDNDHGNVEALRRRCSQSSLTSKVIIFEGDCNIVVDEIVKHVKAIDSHFIRGAWPSLNLAFLDPEGFELRWETVAKLASLARMDLIINFSIYGLRRFMPICIKQDHSDIDDFFGGTEWRDIYYKYAGHSGRVRALLDSYKDKLGALGYEDVRDSTEPLIRNTLRRAPLYYLVFACKHRLGNKFWNDIAQQNLQGQRPLFAL